MPRDHHFTRLVGVFVVDGSPLPDLAPVILSDNPKRIAYLDYRGGTPGRLAEVPCLSPLPISSPAFHVNHFYTAAKESMDMNTLLDNLEPSTVSADEFLALEQKVLRAVEIVRREREARAAAEAEATSLREQLDRLTSASNSAQTQITALNQERDSVRLRVEKMLQQMDELV